MSFSLLFHIKRISTYFEIGLFFVLIFLTQSALSQTEVAGEVSGIWDIEGSPFILIENTIVPVNEELIIEPGVSVLYDSSFNFEVNGRLLAEGAEEDSIYFMSRWEEEERKGRGIRIINADDNSVLQYAVVRNLICSIRIDGTDLTISNCLITECGGRRDGAIDIARESSLLIEFCRIEENNGPGISLNSSSAVVTNNIIRDNAFGGIQTGEANEIIIRNNIITGNASRGISTGGDFALISDNIISENRADRGGGVKISAFHSILRNNIISNNECETNGGGVYTDLANILCTGNLITGNRAGSSGGGIYFQRRLKNAHFYNNTVYGNQADWSGGGIAGNTGSTTNIQNCIIWGNEAEENPQIGMFRGICDNSVVQGGWDGEAIIEENPQFIDPDEGDFDLSDESPCIGSGNPFALYNDSNGNRADIGHFGGNDLLFGFNSDVTFLPAAPTCRVGYPFTLYNIGDEALIMTSELDIPDHFSIDIPVVQELLPNEWIDFNIYFNPLEFGEYDTELILSFEDFEPVEELIIPLHGEAINEYRGDVSGVWIPDISPVHVVESLTILPDHELVIEPGVEVLFDPECDILVTGSIRAISTPEDSIKFTSSQDDLEAGSWGSINARHGIGYFNYCSFEYGTDGVYLARGWLRNSTITNMSEDGVKLKARRWSDAVVSRCLIKDNRRGVSFEIFSRGGTLEHCVVSHCEIGFANGSWGYAYRNVIAYNGIIYLGFGDCLATVEGNIFFENDLLQIQGEFPPDFEYNCVFETPTEGEGLVGDIDRENPNGTPCDRSFNIIQNPQFIDPEEGEFQLQEGSPCIDACDVMWQLDPDGTIADIGAFFREHEGDVVQRMEVDRGWSIISLNIAPSEFFYDPDEDRGPDVRRMFSRYFPNVELFKDDLGRFYSPPNDNFNNIPFWNPADGYLIKMRHTRTLSWFGEQIPADSDIQLDENWNFIAYYPRYQLDADAPDFYVLSPIIDNVLIAKNSDGEFMLPSFNFSNMPPWREGQGYHVKVGEDVVLNYPEEPDGVAFTPPYPPLETRGGDNALARNVVTKQSPRLLHFVRNDGTSENMSVLVVSITGIDTKVGDEIGAFRSDGLLVGNGIVDENSHCGLAIWGDETSTEEVDGLQTGESFTLKLWDSNRDMEIGLTHKSTLKGEGLIYKTDALSVIEMAVTTVEPDDFFLSAAYPNPFNATVRLKYGLPEATDVIISVYDINGRLVANLIDENQQSGYHTTIWNSTGGDACAAVSGIYFIQMSAGEFKSIRKVIQLK